MKREIRAPLLCLAALSLSLGCGGGGLRSDGGQLDDGSVTGRAGATGGRQTGSGGSAAGGTGSGGSAAGATGARGGAGAGVAGGGGGLATGGAGGLTTGEAGSGGSNVAGSGGSGPAGGGAGSTSASGSGGAGAGSGSGTGGISGAAGSGGGSGILDSGAGGSASTGPDAGGASGGGAGGSVDAGAASDGGPACVGQPILRAETPGLVCDDDDWCWVGPEPQSNSNSLLLIYAAWADAPNDVWATGDLGFVWHYNGTAWHVTQPVYNNCHAIWASSSDNAWVTCPGDPEVGPAAILSWDGQQWTNRNPTDNGNFAGPMGVWGTGPSDVWVVGSGGTLSAPVFDFYHWDGSGWTLQAIPNAAATSLFWMPISGLASDDIWSTTGPETFHYDGTTWTQVTAPAGAVVGGGAGGSIWEPPLLELAPNDVWTGDSSFYNWNGQDWSVLQAGTVSPKLTSIWGAAPGDIWFANDSSLFHLDATGTLGQVDPGGGLLIDALAGTSSTDVWGFSDTFAHFDGTAWSDVTPGSHYPLGPNGSGLGYSASAISGTADGTVWIAANYRGSATTAQAMVVSDGVAGWSSLPPVTVAGGSSLGLDAIWANAPDDIWIAGTAGEIEHWDGSAWTAASTSTTASIARLWSDGPTDVWAVGGQAGAATLLNFDGQQWNVTTGAALGGMGTDLGAATAVWGFGPNDVWITGSNAAVLHWDGQQWTESTNSGGGNAIWGTSGSDLWAGGVTLSHFDGTSWTQAPLSPLTPITSISGRSARDVFFATTAAYVTAPGTTNLIYVPAPVYHWDGCAFTSQLLSGARPGVAGATQLWASPVGAVWAEINTDVFVQATH